MRCVPPLAAVARRPSRVRLYNESVHCTVDSDSLAFTQVRAKAARVAIVVIVIVGIGLGSASTVAALQKHFEGKVRVSYMLYRTVRG